DRGAAVPRLQQESACRPQAEDGDDALGPPTGKAISMPAGAVAAVSIEVQPHAVIADVVTRRENPGHRRYRLRCVTHIPVLRGQPRFEERPIEEAPVVLLPRDGGGQALEHGVGSRQPGGHDLDPRARVERRARGRAKGLVDGDLAPACKQIPLSRGTHNSIYFRGSSLSGTWRILLSSFSPPPQRAASFSKSARASL